MPYKLIPRPLHTKVLKIEFLRTDPGSSPLHQKQVYHVEATVNDERCSFEVALLKEKGCALRNRPKAFGVLKNPDRVLGTLVRRFSNGEAVSFPVDLGDIGKV